MSPAPDDDLRRLLHDAVSDVEPTPALAVVQRRTTGRGHAARTWLGVLGAAAAVAAIVTGIAFIEHSTPPVDTNGGLPSPRPTDRSGPQTAKGTGWFVGNTVEGPRLFSESRTFRGEPGASDVQVVTSAVVTGDTEDSELRSAFPAGTTVKVAPGDSSWNVTLYGDSSVLAAAPDDGSGDVGVQAVVRTVQGIVGDSSLVTFSINGERADTVLGVATRAAVGREPDDDVLAPVGIDQPGNGATLGRTFTVRGSAATSAGTVQWELEQRGTVVRNGFATASGCCVQSPYEFTVDEAPIGRYTLVVHDSGGGGALDQDTKDITVVGGGANGNGR